MSARPPGGARARGPLWALLVPSVLGASLLALLLLPLVAMADYPSWSAYAGALSAPGVWQSLGVTLLASGLALAVTLATGVPLGYLLARRKFRGKTWVHAVVTVPLVVPHLVAGIALLLLFEPSSPLGALAIRLGFPVFETIWGAVLVMVYVSASYTVLSCELAFRAVDPSIVETARSLGAGPSEVTASVTLPLAFRGILAGALLSWSRSVSEIGGFLILAYAIYPSSLYTGNVTSPLSIYIYNLYSLGDLAGAAAVSSLLVLVAFLLFLTIRYLESRGTFPWARGELFP